MVQFIQLLTDIARLWHIREARRIRDSFLLAVFVAVIFIVPGAFLGGLSWTLKVVWLEVGMTIAVITVIRLAYYRTVMGTEISALLGEHKGKKVKIPIEAVNSYIRFVAGFLASELAVGLIALWLPGHKNPAMAIMAIFASMVFITHTIWQEGESWWPKLVYRMAMATFMLSILMVFLPKTSILIGEKIGNIDDGIVSMPSSEFQPTPRAAEIPYISLHAFPDGVKQITIPIGPERWEGITLPLGTTAYRVDPTSWHQLKPWNGKPGPIVKKEETAHRTIPINTNRDVKAATFWIRGEKEATITIE